MHLAQYQTRSTVFVICLPGDLKALPEPSYTTPLHGEWGLVEFPRTKENLVALALCGLPTEQLIAKNP